MKESRKEMLEDYRKMLLLEPQIEILDEIQQEALGGIPEGFSETIQDSILGEFSKENPGILN